MDNSRKKFTTAWRTRADNYDKLFWTRDKGYLNEIIRQADLRPEHLVVDVGTGTGVMADAIKNQVYHVVCIDSSGAMLNKGQWDRVSVINWNIGDALFANGIFDRIIARMVFHHILDNLERAVLRCYDLLKTGGKIIVAEGVPPNDDEKVVDWYTKMFKLKEKRRVFTMAMLADFLRRSGFVNVKTRIYRMRNFSVANWLVNSGLGLKRRREIMKIHADAPLEVKRAYNMRIKPDDCIVNVKNVILIGEKL